MEQKLPALEFAYDALEPVISKGLMEIHHGKHHQGYVNKMNAAMAKLAQAQAAGDVAAMTAVLPGLEFNAGGHINHSFFWKSLAPVSKGGGKPPKGKLLAAIKAQFGSVEAFIAAFNAKAVGVKGSGWGWLVYNTELRGLQIVTRFNQDVIAAPLVPLLTVDVWEHAYYLDYKNMRGSFLTEIWKVINWKFVEANYEAATK